MNHDEIRVLLSAYVDKELSGAEKKVVDEHLRGCPDCRQRVSQLVVLKRSVHALGDLDLPYAFASNLAHAIDHDEEVTVSWIGIEHFAQRIAVGLTLFVLLLIGITTYSQHDDPGTVERYVVGLSTDSAGSQIFTKQGALTKDDVMLAVFTK